MNKNKRVTIKDLAAKANVSTGTIDRVLHNRGRVAPEVKKRVEAAIEELGYQRNILASALAYNHNFRLTVMLPQSEKDRYWEQVNRGVQEAIKTVQQYGFTIELHHFDLDNPQEMLDIMQEVYKNPPAGLLFPPLFMEVSREILAKCQEHNIPVVIINTDIEETETLSYIGQDSYQSGVLAAQLLNFGLEHGETAILLNLDYQTRAAQHLIDKEKGFKDFFARIPDKEIKIEKLSFEDFKNKSKLGAFAEQLFRDYPNLSSIFVTNSRANYFLDVLNEEQMNRLKIVGFDLIEPNLKYLYSGKINFLINQNPVEQGYLGIMNFFKLLFKKEEVEAIQYLPLDIVVKENVQYYLKRQRQFDAVLRL